MSTHASAAAFEAFDLTGRVAVVTGGGTGIGQACAMLLAGRGADVAITGRRLEPLEKTAAAIREQTGRRAFAIPADVSDAAAARAMIDAVAQQLGGIGILVNNAGKPTRHVALAKIDPAEWDYDVRLNLSAALYCSQAALPHLRKSGRGAIVNISSAAGIGGATGVGAYSSAKAGLQMLTRVSSAEWGPKVRVNCVAPGMTATEDSRERWERLDFDPSQVYRHFPLNRYGLVEEMAQAVAFFASDASAYVTGETLAVVGGPAIGGMFEVDEDAERDAL
jgi:NAD(P)-dependent dehydrogenase (short-subunit alcohol dehydrogenase family)